MLREKERPAQRERASDKERERERERARARAFAREARNRGIQPEKSERLEENACVYMCVCMRL